MAVSPTFSALPGRETWASDTTLFRVAEEYLGDALRWQDIANLNGLVDPWITAPVLLKIPPTSKRGGANG